MFSGGETGEAEGASSPLKVLILQSFEKNRKKCGQKGFEIF